MLEKIEQIKGRALRARDGDIGSVKDVYFDDRRWGVRYLVVQTGAWLNQRKVLISPEALGPMQWSDQVFPVDLTVEQVRNSPSIDTDKPVSRQHEETLRQYYGWPPYWATFGNGGMAMPLAASAAAEMEVDVPLSPPGDPFLRSAEDTIGHHIEAIDGAIGHVDDFLIDDELWLIRYFIVDTRNWWPGKKVLVAPAWIKDVRWEKRIVVVDLTRDSIRESPPYDVSAPWNSADAAELHDFYGRPRYSDWEADLVAGAAKSPPRGHKRERP